MTRCGIPATTNPTRCSFATVSMGISRWIVDTVGKSISGNPATSRLAIRPAGVISVIPDSEARPNMADIAVEQSVALPQRSAGVPSLLK